MRQAIALPYCSGQGEPSRPVKQLVNVPDNVAERDAMLKQLFVETVYDGVTVDKVDVCPCDADDYGDLVVEARGGYYLYITFLA